MTRLTIPSPQPAPQGPGLESGDILVVDDDPMNRDPLARRLQRRGYRVATAVDGPDALGQIAARGFDVVLLDVMMPGMCGLEVLKHIRQTHPATELPVIMATARDASEDVVAALELGASDYVTKPLDFAVVAARVKTHLLLKQSIRRAVELQKSLQERNRELEDANRQLSESARRTRLELEAAARVQAALLPVTYPPIPQVRCAWALRACDQLAGDALDVFAIDKDHLGFYVLDVSGHGVAASLSAFAATRMLSDVSHPDSPDGVLEPSRVADRLNRNFSWNQETAQFFTLFYGVLHAPSRRLTYVSAGHPSAIRVSADARTATLDSTAMPIGVGDSFRQAEVTLDPGDRIYAYSDGLSETMNAGKEQLGTQRLATILARERGAPLERSIDVAMREADRWREDGPVRDDVSVIAVECAGGVTPAGDGRAPLGAGESL